jgi:hypothetical protein
MMLTRMQLGAVAAAPQSRLYIVPARPNRVQPIVNNLRREFIARYFRAGILCPLNEVNRPCYCAAVMPAGDPDCVKTRRYAILAN